MSAEKISTRTFTITFAFITILLIISTAQARSKDRDSSSSSSDQSPSTSAAPARQSAPPAQVSQRESRTESGDRGQKTEVRIREEARRTPPEQSRTSEARSQKTEDRIRQEAKQAQVAAPSQTVATEVRSQKSEDRIRKRTQRAEIASPITQSTRQAQPRIEQQQTAPATTPSVSTGSSERRARIAPPVARSLEVAKTEVRGQKTEDRIKEETKQSQVATPIAPSVERTQPRGVQATRTVKTTSDAAAARSEARRQIVMPLSQSTEVVKSEARSQKPEVRIREEARQTPSEQSRTSEARSQKTEDRRQESGDRIRQETKPAEIAAPIANAQKSEKAKISDRSTVAERMGKDNRNDRNQRTTATAQQTTIASPRLSKDNSQRPAPQRLAPNTTERSTFDRTERREKIVRGTAGREVSTPSTGNLMNVERAVSAVDARSSHRTAKNETTIINNRTIVNNFDGRGGRANYYSGHRDDHDGRWWNRGGSYNYGGHHNDGGHHSNVFLNIGFYSGYSYSGWAPVVYEPAVCTVAYAPVWPSHYRSIYYGCGPRYAVSYVYPAYHRRYVFMSVGGYWPSYSYARYYWYDCHPWYWYGAEPVAYQVDGGDNYYTYNYYGSDNAGTSVSSSGALTPGTIVNGVEVPDYDALRSAAGRQATIPPQAALQTPPQQPAAPTESDKLFDDGVTAFGDGNYPAAIEQFQRAVRLEPNDVILPFAYAQALFANNDYEQAAAVLQTALNAMAPAKPEVFFPRGLYKDDAVLTAQIKNLERAVMMNPTNPGLQLLYGYQLLGIGKADDAKVPLSAAQRDARTAGPASTLLNLIDRVKAESQTKK